ncbi:NAD(P)/FAD-dependent oxidoreductase [Candidatus Heimdallarchaeota archaeon]|nr:MAG: NAD(P)/FAD-dependent oxidoreductase [Candidatus Heimdallarchaeota archaeon]
MKDEYDVIVIGGGPAGVSASLSCRRKNLETLLIDKKPKDLIGDKVCGEAISKSTSHFVSQKLGIKPPTEDEINVPVKELVLKTSLPEDHIILPAIGYMINRHKYGQRLLKNTEEAGTEVIAKTKVIEPIVTTGKVSGIRIKDSEGNEREISAKIIIDCSGVRGVVRTKLPTDFEPKLVKILDKSDYASCYREIIELEQRHGLDGKIVLKYEENIPEPGYIWFFADGEYKLNCGTGFIKEGENQNKSVKEVYFEAMEKHYSRGSYKTVDGRGGVVSIRPPLWNAVAPGLMIAGDAAYHADPLTAEGHGPALMAGYFAGLVASKAIKKEDFSTESLWEYNKLVFSDFGAEHARNRILTIVLERIGPKKLEFLLERKVVRQEDLTTKGIMKKRSIGNYVLLALRCFPRYSLLLLMRKAISISKKIAKLCEEYPENPEDYQLWKEEIENLYSKIERK